VVRQVLVVTASQIVVAVTIAMQVMVAIVVLAAGKVKDRHLVAEAIATQAVTIEEAVAVIVVVDLVPHKVPLSNRKLIQKQYRKKYAKRKPSFPVLPVAKTLKPNIAAASVKKWLKSVQRQSRQIKATLYRLQSLSL